LIIAVGHTREYMDNMLGLLPDVPVFKVFNGADPHDDELHAPNHSTGRDIAMMKAGLDATGWDRAVFINDSVKRIDPRFWDAEGDIVGGANLSSWVDYANCDSMALAFHKARGRNLLFVRTSIFKMTANLFNQLWDKAGQSAQTFEKATLTTTAYVNIVPHTWLMDNNLAKYV
jgi:hypothetical protein